ncbi:MAG: HAMP domain-containing protein [Ignavibacteriales bacterium]|nr:HAMP domain-containing protein [Ignavibacteriales bacterium]
MYSWKTQPDGSPWFANQQNHIFSLLSEQNRTNTLLSLFLVSFSIVAGYIVSQILTSPLIGLTKAAEQITSGDLKARAQVTAQDEIGNTGNCIQSHDRSIQSNLYQGLEQRVAERTTDLELSRQQSLKRANELQSIGEISKIITGEQKLENLLPLITRLVSERFDFYHTGIFLIDNTNQFAVSASSKQRRRTKTC